MPVETRWLTFEPLEWENPPPLELSITELVCAGPGCGRRFIADTTADGQRTSTPDNPFVRSRRLRPVQDNDNHYCDYCSLSCYCRDENGNPNRWYSSTDAGRQQFAQHSRGSRCVDCGSQYCRGVEMAECDACEETRCTHCAADRPGSCNECHTADVLDNGTRCGCGLCYDMAERRNSRRPGEVRNYTFRPNPYRPKGVYRGPDREPLLGLELEVGGTNRSISNAVMLVDDNEDHIYMKHDGSIEGVELVTHPMTLSWAKEYQFDTLLAELRRRDCYVRNNYGLHIHVSRRAFNRAQTSHQMTWLMFMYRNERALSLLARRTSTRYAAFNTPTRGELKAKATPAPFHGDRYVAVNCNNDRTYELRFFKSTLDPEEFWAALEFADASVKYTGQLAAADVLRGNGLHWAKFNDWAVKDGSYPNLVAQIAKMPRSVRMVLSDREMETAAKLSAAARRRRRDDSGRFAPENPAPTAPSIRMTRGGSGWITSSSPTSVWNDEYTTITPAEPTFDLLDAVERAGEGGQVQRTGITYNVTREDGEWWIRENNLGAYGNRVIGNSWTIPGWRVVRVAPEWLSRDEAISRAGVGGVIQHQSSVMGSGQQHRVEYGEGRHVGIIGLRISGERSYWMEATSWLANDWRVVEVAGQPF